MDTFYEGLTIGCIVASIVCFVIYKKSLNRQKIKFINICASMQRRRDYYRNELDRVEELCIRVKNLYMAQEDSQVKLFPKGCDRREVYKRLMNIYHPDKPNGNHKITVEIRKQFNKK